MLISLHEIFYFFHAKMYALNNKIDIRYEIVD